jgi:histidinol-phosphate aminotransferase
MPYNVGVLAQAAGAFLLRHGAVFDAQAARIRADREQLHAVLAAMPGVTAWPSAANFILFRVQGPRSQDVHGQLLKAGVLIKNLDGVHPLLRDCLRVTVGTAAENAAFLAALGPALAG